MLEDSLSIRPEKFYMSGARNSRYSVSTRQPGYSARLRDHHFSRQNHFPSSGSSFSALAGSISDSLPKARAVIDGEICSLDRRGRPQFKNLLFRRGNPPCFFAFDLLTCDGMDLRLSD